MITLWIARLDAFTAAFIATPCMNVAVSNAKGEKRYWCV